jgi:peptidylprolyl isomerase
MKLGYTFILGAGLLATSAVAYSASSNSRRNFLSQSVTKAAGLAVATVGIGASLPSNANAADDSAEDPLKDFITTESGMMYKVTKEGTGAVPQAGQTVKAHYTGWLEGFDSEKKFDSSRDRNRPFNFKVGAGQVIRGWDESFGQMAVGERRQIILPPRLGYGDRGAGGIIPGGATLYFVSLLCLLLVSFWICAVSFVCGTICSPLQIHSFIHHFHRMWSCWAFSNKILQ